MNYFMSAAWGDERGIFNTDACGTDGTGAKTCGAAAGYTNPAQGANTWSMRGNFSFSPMDELDIRFNTFYSHKNIDWMPDGNNAEGLLLNVFRGGSDYTNDTDGKTLTMKLNNLNDHFVTGVNMLFNPGNGMSHRLNAGIDWTRNTYGEDRPWGFFYKPVGEREVDDRTFRKLTLDYAGTWEADLFGAASSFSWGGQLYNDFSSGINGFGEGFAGPGDKVLESGAVTEAYEYNSTVTSGGFFLQQQFGFGDKLFLTAGLRVDGHSAFGSDFGLEPYPKASVAYVVSDEGFFPEDFGMLKLRAAIGESGKAPGLFDAARTSVVGSLVMTASLAFRRTTLVTRTSAPSARSSGSSVLRVRRSTIVCSSNTRTTIRRRLTRSLASVSYRRVVSSVRSSKTWVRSPTAATRSS